MRNTVSLKQENLEKSSTAIDCKVIMHSDAPQSAVTVSVL